MVKIIFWRFQFLKICIKYERVQKIAEITNDRKIREKNQVVELWALREMPRQVEKICWPQV